MKILSMKTSLSSSQKPNKLALQPIKACKTFEHFQLGLDMASTWAVSGLFVIVVHCRQKRLSLL